MVGFQPIKEGSVSGLLFKRKTIAFQFRLKNLLADCGGWV